MCTARRAPHRRAFFAVVLVVLVARRSVVAAPPAAAATPTPDDARRVAAAGRRRGRASRSTRRPPSTAPGHRGADLAAAPGTPVRAANDGVVSFAGYGRRHAARHRRPRRRPAHLVLVPRVGRRCGPGSRWPAATWSAPPAASATDHDGAVLHLGLRVGDRYVDPMLLFRPDDLTKLVHLVPADEPAETPWSPAGERRDAAVVAAAADARCRRRPWRYTDADDRATPASRCIGDAVDAACDVGTLARRQRRRRGRRRPRLPRRHHRPRGRRASTALRASVATTRRRDARRCRRRLAGALARTPAGHARARPRRHRATLRRHRHRRLQRRRARRRRHRRVRAPGDGRRRDQQRRGGVGPRAHRRARRRRRSATTRPRARSATSRTPPTAARYTEGRHPRSDRRVAPRCSRRSCARCSASSPAARSTSSRTRRVGSSSTCSCRTSTAPATATLPPLGNVVTLSSPHEGAPLATAGRQIRATTLGHGRARRSSRSVSPFPPPSSPAVQELAEGSPLIDEPAGPGRPGALRLTTIGATEDVVVPATNISLPGATETVAAVERA